MSVDDDAVTARAVLRFTFDARALDPLRRAIREAMDTSRPYASDYSNADREQLEACLKALGGKVGGW